MTAMARIALALVVLLAGLAPAGAVERILRFVSDVAVERNGDLAVTETIAVQAEGRDIRRGILRDFPTSYRRRDGARVEVGFDVQSVTRDGAPENWVTERLSNGVRVRIGSADRLLSTGRHEYVIRYRTTRQIGFFADYDELYWNATGTGWTFPIDQAEARITLPEAVPFRQTAFYTGPQDAQRQGRDHRRAAARPHRVPHHPPAACPQRPHRRGRLAEGRGEPAERGPEGDLAARGQHGARGGADRPRAGPRLLRAGVAVGRPRSAQGHDHSAVRPAGRDVGRRRTLCRSDGLRQSRLRGRDHRSRRQRPYQAGRPGAQHAGRAARGRQADRAARAGLAGKAVFRDLALAAAHADQPRADQQGQGCAQAGAGGGLPGQAVCQQLRLVRVRPGGGDRRDRGDCRDRRHHLRQRQRGGGDHRHAHPDRTGHDRCRV